MTLPQIQNALTQGKPPRPGVRTFNTPAESRAWRAEQKRLVAEAEAEREQARRWGRSRPDAYRPGADLVRQIPAPEPPRPVEAEVPPAPDPAVSLEVPDPVAFAIGEIARLRAAGSSITAEVEAKILAEARGEPAETH